MPLSRRDLPNVGEHVIATVKEIFEYGAYVELDEFNNLKAYLPWNEVSSKWVRSIRDVLREEQKIVVKVIRVDHKKRTVDVSLKKVVETERKRKMMWWKRYVKACKIVEIVASKLGKSIEEAYREVVWKLEDHYGNPYVGLEEAVVSGREALLKAGVPETWVDELIAEASKHVKVKTVRKRTVVSLRSLERKGVEIIKGILSTIEEKYSRQNVKVEAYTLGSPRYAIEVYAYDYKEAEKTLREVIDDLMKLCSERKVECSEIGVKQ